MFVIFCHDNTHKSILFVKYKVLINDQWNFIVFIYIRTFKGNIPKILLRPLLKVYSARHLKLALLIITRLFKKIVIETECGPRLSNVIKMCLS